MSSSSTSRACSPRSSQLAGSPFSQAHRSLSCPSQSVHQHYQATPHDRLDLPRHRLRRSGDGARVCVDQLFRRGRCRRVRVVSIPVVRARQGHKLRQSLAPLSPLILVNRDMRLICAIFVARATFTVQGHRAACGDHDLGPTQRTVRLVVAPLSAPPFRKWSSPRLVPLIPTVVLCFICLHPFAFTPALRLLRSCFFAPSRFAFPAPCLLTLLAPFPDVLHSFLSLHPMDSDDRSPPGGEVRARARAPRMRLDLLVPQEKFRSPLS